MNLRDDDNDYGRSSIKMPTVILVASAAIFVVLAIVLAVNNKGKNKHDYYKPTSHAQVSETTTQTDEHSTLTAKDLNFWNMYQDNDSDNGSMNTLNRKDELMLREEEMNKAALDAEAAELEEEEANKDPNDDGKHTLVTHMDGTTEWVGINSSLKLNSYDDTSFEKQNGIINYYMNGRKTTKTGVDISEYTTKIAWNTLGSEVDFVMIRVGSRGYDSGRIIGDTKFIENVQNATKYNIPFGLYFSSQATTQAEAKEEANYVLEQIALAKLAVEQNQPVQTTNSTTSTTTNTTTVDNLNSTPTNLVMSVPVMTAGLTSTASDNDGNTTRIYGDGTAVTTYANGNIVTAYSNGAQITNFDNGSVEKIDVNGNKIEIDEKGNYTIKDSSGKTTASGTTSLPNNTNNTGTNTNNTTNNSNNTTNNTTNNANTPVASGYTFKVSYPIAVEMHLIPNDISRVEALTMAERTEVLQYFCDTIKPAGYTPMVCADKEMLLTKLNLSILNKYDIWVNNIGDIPDYPYLMTIWRYDASGKVITSLTGDYGINACFVDYQTR